MITASFNIKNGNFYRFRISGHSGYAEQGSDIVCAAVSSMAQLTVNNITESFSLNATVVADENGPVIDCRLNDDSACGYALIAGLERELTVLASDYPNYIRVIVK